MVCLAAVRRKRKKEIGYGADPSLPYLNHEAEEEPRVKKADPDTPQWKRGIHPLYPEMNFLKGKDGHVQEATRLPPLPPRSLQCPVIRPLLLFLRCSRGRAVAPIKRRTFVAMHAVSDCSRRRRRRSRFLERNRVFAKGSTDKDIGD